MKRLFILFFLGFLSLQLVQAQAPQSINYQTVIRVGGNVVANSPINFLYAFEDANASIIFEESHNVTTNEFGLINIVLGEGTPVIGSFDQIDWAQEGMQFEAEVTYNGTIYSLGRVPLKSVAYSLFSDEAAFADTASYADTAAFALNVNSDSAIYASSAGMAIYADTAAYASVAASLDTDRILLNGANGNLNVQASPGLTPDLGYIGVADAGGNIRAFMDVWDQSQTGRMLNFGVNGNLNVRTSFWINDPNTGLIQIYDPNGVDKVLITGGDPTASGPKSGSAEFLGDNGNDNVIVRGGLFSGISQDHGGIGVYDAAGANQAAIYVDANGDGIVFGDVKNFRIPHPTQADKEIWYASLEGPEAGAYVRGTGQLVNGEGIVNFPDHFSAIANAQSMTVVLTPLSADSEGMAVVEKTAQGFKVKELRRGTGNYSFDWEVKAVRKGYENYRPVRNASEYQPRVSAEERRKMLLPAETSASVQKALIKGNSNK